LAWDEQEGEGAGADARTGYLLIALVAYIFHDRRRKVLERARELFG
jgi:hypothetical protein